ncbi:B12-binding domain-containing radical SAM protein [Desulfuromonas versatilis]|uniref:B12-binding domain-containing radical SAM protein n=1 Tax=Desulfuromonas versatilis TaxID=2802975 RepID=A0ABN6DSJ5_9BACT|nr:B12-binding domain-containing radical SAM protein [Desulfuromonas versatilis]BCR03150.1 B12-binding domain-containing radical SAM protein [Desulfuromonas versatilis]
MNILLIYPEFPDTFWSFKHALKLAHKRASSPPLGLLTVAAILPPDWGKRLVDLNVTRLTAKDLAWADAAFVSAMLVQRESARQIIAQCRTAGIRIIAGGPLFTSECEKFEEVDHFVLNEGELTLPPFLADFARGEARRVYRTSAFADIQNSPAPLWDLIDIRSYAAMSLQYSRGCPFHCEFCNVTALYGHQPRTKSTAQVIAELDLLYGRGWRGSVFFVDDNFIGNKKHLKADLLPALIAWQKNRGGLSFYTEASINLADDAQLVEMMVEAGFDTVFIGIETPNEASLAESGKRQNQSRNLVEDVKRLQAAGLQVQGGFIVGFDSDTPTIFQSQIDFIQKSGIVTAMVGLLQALPGTRLYERLKREGRLLSDSTGDNVSISTNMIPKMDLDALQEGYKMILRTIYSPESYYQRVKAFLQEYRPPMVRSRMSLGYKMALFHALYRLGILGKERLFFWKVLLWTLLKRPRLFPHAVTLAIYGYHFRIICERYILQ